MAIDLERLRVLGRQDLQLGVLLQRASQIPKLAIDARDYGVIGQPGADRFCNIQGRASGWNGLLADIGRSTGEAFAHVNFRLSCYGSFAYSALACFRIGRSGSAFFHSAKKSWYAVFAFALSPAKA